MSLFELSIAWKYLLPKRRQLSVSIISLISILVISLVIWLILVFFSVTKGLERVWIEKLVSITSPIRITPTDAYYHSYYYLIDQHSNNSDYELRSIGEKNLALSTNPYDPEVDGELAKNFPRADYDEKGELKDLVKRAYQAISKIPEVTPTEYEISTANLRLRLLRGLNTKETIQSFLTQPIYIGSFEEKNDSYSKTLLPLTKQDLHNVFQQATLANDISDNPENLTRLSMDKAQERLQKIVSFLGANGDPTLSLNELNQKHYTAEEKTPFFAYYKIKDKDSLLYRLPHDPMTGFGVVVPKSFKEAGTLVGDRGYISYNALAVSSIQEQRMPVFVAGFYDPGIVPLGGKFVLAPPELVRILRTAQQQEMSPMTNGIHIRYDNLNSTEAIKEKLKEAFNENGIAPYWKIETFREYDYSKDLLQQLKSEKNIFSLIAGVIIIVACSNIISMLIILVNNKKSEIGILRSMGASSASIACIFGFCGAIMGLAGSLIGTILAFITLRNLQSLLELISKVQGYDAFNPVFYGDHLPNTMSYETLGYVVIATALVSMIAGLIPALKASRVQPSSILRQE